MTAATWDRRLPLTEAHAEACGLGERAYGGCDPAAFAHAERVLHTIHAAGGFAAPRHPLVAAIWLGLHHAKLARAFAGDHPAVASAAQLAADLNALVDRLGAYNHPFFDALAAEPAGDTRALTIHIANWFGSTDGFVDQLAQLGLRSPPAIRAMVVRNLADEFVGVPHDDLRRSFIERAGCDYDRSRAAEDPDRVPASFALSSYRTGVCALMPTASYALGSFFTIEANFPRECRRMLQILRGRGFEDASLRIFSLHVDTDEDHAGEWLEAIETLDPGEWGAVVAGAEAQLQHRRRMFDAMLALYDSP